MKKLFISCLVAILSIRSRVIAILGIVHVHIHLRSNLWKSLLLQSSV